MNIFFFLWVRTPHVQQRDKAKNRNDTPMARVMMNIVQPESMEVLVSEQFPPVSSTLYFTIIPIVKCKKKKSAGQSMISAENSSSATIVRQIFSSACNGCANEVSGVCVLHFENMEENEAQSFGKWHKRRTQQIREKRSEVHHFIRITYNSFHSPPTQRKNRSSKPE